VECSKEKCFISNTQGGAIRAHSNDVRGCAWVRCQMLFAMPAGSHIHCSPPASERAFYRNRKGFLSQNCLFACSFNLQFIYAFTGWEGSAADARVYENACSWDLLIPDGKYYFADAGFPSCRQLLIPYCGPRYHLAEWGRACVRQVSSYYSYLFKNQPT
jgi:hypothetical protein